MDILGFIILMFFFAIVFFFGLVLGAIWLITKILHAIRSIFIN